MQIYLYYISICSAFTSRTIIIVVRVKVRLSIAYNIYTSHTAHEFLYTAVDIIYYKHYSGETCTLFAL